MSNVRKIRNRAPRKPAREIVWTPALRFAVSSTFFAYVQELVEFDEDIASVEVAVREAAEAGLVGYFKGSITEVFHVLQVTGYFDDHPPQHQWKMFNVADAYASRIREAVFELLTEADPDE